MWNPNEVIFSFSIGRYRIEIIKGSKEGFIMSLIFTIPVCIVLISVI